jgi:hypothetical protein
VYILSKREKVLIAMLIIILFFYVYYKFYLSNVLAKVGNAKSNIKKYESSISILQSNSNKKTEGEMGIHEKYKAAQEYVPKEERNFEIANYINNISEIYKVIINNIQFGEITEHDLDSKVVSKEGQKTDANK